MIVRVFCMGVKNGELSALRQSSIKQIISR